LYHAFDPLAACVIAACSIAMFYLVAGMAEPGYGFVIAEAVLVVIPVTVASSRRLGLGALGIAPTRLVFVAAAVLIGATTWYLNWRLVKWVRPPGNTDALDAETGRLSLGAVIVMIAMVPPICEEILFRGVLARGLATRLPGVVAIVVSALVFSAYHLSTLQAIPTFTLGLVLALLAIRADSVIPGIVAHALNNGVAIVVAREDVPGLGGWFEAHPDIALYGCAAATTAGLALVILAPRAPR
jgi:membrane protease YdiL (CAAX protease family)